MGDEVLDTRRTHRWSRGGGELWLDRVEERRPPPAPLRPSTRGTQPKPPVTAVSFLATAIEQESTHVKDAVEANLAEIRSLRQVVMLVLVVVMSLCGVTLTIALLAMLDSSS